MCIPHTFGVDSSSRFSFRARTHRQLDNVTDDHPTHASATDVFNKLLTYPPLAFFAINAAELNTAAVACSITPPLIGSRRAAAAGKIASDYGL